MKKNIFLLIIIQALSGMATAQTSLSFKLQCTLTLPAPGYLYLSYPKDGQWGKDSCMIKEGRAEFKGSVPGPTLARLTYGQKEKEIFIEPANIFFAGTVDDFPKGRVTGSKTQREFDILNASLQKINTRWKIVMDTVMAVARRNNAAFQELKAWALVPYFEEIQEANLSFIAKYPASFVTAYTLQIVARDLATDSIKLFYNRFPANVKRSAYGKNIQAQIERRKVGVAGAIAADFSQPDINGNTIRLADFKGKYVLLDFWASWCVPCRKGSPHLIELYTKYKNQGMEIIGVSADDNSSAWKKAISDDHLPWYNILQGNTAENMAIKYNIVYLPTRILIDKDGKIIGRYNEQEEGLNKMLESIFK